MTVKTLAADLTGRNSLSDLSTGCRKLLRQSRDGIQFVERIEAADGCRFGLEARAGPV
jgi:hypothetical protein